MSSFCGLLRRNNERDSGRRSRGNEHTKQWSESLPCNDAPASISSPIPQHGWNYGTETCLGTDVHGVIPQDKAPLCLTAILDGWSVPNLCLLFRGDAVCRYGLVQLIYADGAASLVPMSRTECTSSRTASYMGDHGPTLGKRTAPRFLGEPCIACKPIDQGYLTCTCRMGLARGTADARAT